MANSAISGSDLGIYAYNYGALTVVIGDGSNVIPALSGLYLRVPFALTFTGFEIVGDVSGTISVDVKKCTYSGFPTDSSITASLPISLSSAQKTLLQR